MTKLVLAVNFRLLFERRTVPISHGPAEYHDRTEIKFTWNCSFIYLFIYYGVLLHETQRDLHTHSGYYAIHLIILTNLITQKQTLVETLQRTDHLKLRSST